MAELPSENKLPVGSLSQPAVILAIEDDAEDVELLRLALAHAAFPCRLVSVSFAWRAMRYLTRNGEYADEAQFPWPTLILLDLSLPGMNGMEFLTWAQAQPNMPPIVILTHSHLREDKERATKLGAKSYFVKSLDLKQTTGMLEMIRTLALPPISPGAPSAPQNPG